MLKGEFFSKFGINAKLVQGNDEEIIDYREKVKVKFDGCIERARIIDTPELYGFDKAFSFSNVYPQSVSKWSEANTLNPNDVFFMADKIVLLNTSGGDIPFNLLDTDKEILSDVEKSQRQKYNFKTLDKFNEIIEASEILTFTTELESRYKSIVGHFLQVDEKEIKNIKDDIILTFSKEELSRFLRSLKIDSYSKSGYIISTYNLTFNLLGLDIKVNASSFIIQGDKRKYIKKDELLEYCNVLQNVQASYILYGTFMGLSENQFEILRKLKISDIDENEMIINWEGKKIPIDEEFYNIALACNEEYISTDRTLDGVDSNEYQLNMESKFILKPRIQSNNNYGLNPMSAVAIRTFLARISKFLFNSTDMNKTFLHRSGILHRMYIVEKEKGINWTTYNSINNKDLPFTFNIRDMLLAYNNNYKNNKNSDV